ncbi:MAG TPA: hypothetical protein VF042_00680 [Gemmatimonadaceae bacterium]
MHHRSSLIMTIALLASAIISCDENPASPSETVPASIDAASPVEQLAVAGTAVVDLPSVLVSDAEGNAAVGVPVIFAITEGNGTLTGASTTTDAGGRATVGGWTTGATPGTNTLKATVADLPQLSFHATTVKSGTAFKTVLTGTDFSCGVTVSRAGYCWGNGAYGSLGAGKTPTLTDRPVPISGGVIFQMLDLNFRRACGLNEKGLAFCWGYTRQIGTAGTETIMEPSPVGGELRFTQIATGEDHACGLTDAGKAFCWGSNASGQLGDGTAIDHSDPVAVTGGLTFKTLASGYAHTCGLAVSGGAYCWGDNGSGQIGDGSSVQRLSPVAVSGGLQFQSISGGLGYTCAIALNGAAYCWGRNDGPGNLGDGTTAAKSTPTAVVGGLTFNLIAAGARSTCGLAIDGSAYCWGSNAQGKLGDGTIVDRLVPAPAASALKFRTIATSATHTCGVALTFETYCWGDNFDGALGNGTNTNPRANPNPVAVLTP